ncbi:MAG: hypothetical protein JWN85_256 [Gammaproteobacteria bacterium]|nr:hypothetical protein [Gammaproteobacteria bacterium]
MKLQEALKTSLDELRMQMLGVQVLFGFQFQGLFQNGFPDVSSTGRLVDVAGMALIVLALGLLIAVPCQHRLVDGGETTRRIHRTSTQYARFALLPLAGAIGCAVFVATGRPFGPTLSTAMALFTFSIAVGAWYGLGLALRRAWAIQDSEAPMNETHTPLHAKIEQMLTEARVILPGAQALLGFQLVVMLTKAFDSLPFAVRVAHLGALGCLALAIVLLISPAAIHRITFGGSDHPRMHSTGSMLVAMALLPLACAICLDLWVALNKLFGLGRVALAGAIAAFVLLVGLWYLLPLALRRSKHQAPASA